MLVTLFVCLAPAKVDLIRYPTAMMRIMTMNMSLTIFPTGLGHLRHSKPKALE